MRIAYFVQSHDAPELLARLVARLREPRSGALIIVGHDASRGPVDVGALPAGDDVVLRLGTEPVRRGELSCIQPYLDTCHWLVDAAIDFDWLVYISGRDYPVRRVAEIERDLAAADCDGFLRYWDVASPASPWGRKRARRRYGYHYRRLPEAARWPLRLAKPFLRLLGLELSLVYGVHLGTPVRDALAEVGLVCYGGLQWCTLRRSAVQALAAATRAGQPILEHLRHTLVPDEVLVPTLLVNGGRFRLVDEGRRFADTHERPEGHARVLTLADAPRLTDGSCDFARRFDLAESGELLAWLDAEVHGLAS